MMARRIKVLLDRGPRGMVDVRLALVSEANDLHDEEILLALESATDLVRSHVMKQRQQAPATLPMGRNGAERRAA